MPKLIIHTEETNNNQSAAGAGALGIIRGKKVGDS